MLLAMTLWQSQVGEQSVCSPKWSQSMSLSRLYACCY